MDPFTFSRLGAMHQESLDLYQRFWNADPPSPSKIEQFSRLLGRVSALLLRLGTVMPQRIQPQSISTRIIEPTCVCECAT